MRPLADALGIPELRSPGGDGTVNASPEGERIKQERGCRKIELMSKIWLTSTDIINHILYAANILQRPPQKYCNLFQNLYFTSVLFCLPAVTDPHR